MTPEETRVIRELAESLRLLLRGVAPTGLRPAPPDANDALADLWAAVAALVESFGEASEFLGNLSKGLLDASEPPARNHLISPFKRLHANLRHLTWQTSRVAKGDLNQRVDFLGEFSTSFNEMIASLREKRVVEEALRKAHTELAENEALFRALFEASPIPLCLIDKAGAVVEGNRRLESAFGYKRGDVRTLDELWRLAFPDERYRSRVVAEWTADVRGADEEGREVTPKEYRITCKDGSERLVVISGVQVEDRRLVVFLDVTERKKFEEALKLSEERYRGVFENAAVGIDLVDHEGRFLEVNDAFARMLGYSREELQNLTIFDVTHPEDLESSKSKFLELGRNESDAYRLEKRYVRKDGEVVWVDLSVSGLWTPQGEHYATMGVIVDITRRLELAKQLLHAQKMEAVGTLAGGVAHDFNNLLQVIIGFADLGLEDTDKAHPAYEELGEIRLAALRAAELTQSLLAFSRRVDAKLEPVDLNEQVHCVVKMLERTLPKAVEISLRLSDRLMKVNADQTQLQQLIMNLAVNARDAMPLGGALVFETRNVALDEEYCKSHLEVKPGDYAVLSVSDTGEGMDAETRRHIFDPFFTTKEIGKGTGLGLAIAFGVAQGHGGHIACESEPGRGATFTIFLPAARNQEETVAVQESDSTVRGSGTVLLIDDEESLRRFGRQCLSRAGYSVFTAAYGQEGVEMYRRLRDKVDVVILDVMMPIMGGMECLKALQEINPSVRVIIATGFPMDDPDWEDLAKHSAGILKKPYDINQMAAVVRRVLASA